MSASRSPSSIISDSVFRSANTMSPGSISSVANGRRSISGQLLSFPDSGYGSSMSSSVSSSTAQSPPPAPAALEIPANLETAATLQWIGFDAATADLVVNGWLRDQGHRDRSLQWHIERHIRHFNISEPCGSTKEGNWHVAMRQLGVAEKMQDAVMDPDFARVRTMHPLRHWLEEFIVGNYLTLVHMDERLNYHILQRQTGVPHLRGGAGGPDDRPSYYARPKGFTTLYRATTAGRINGVFLGDDKVALSETMSVSSVASDFGFDKYGVFYYWTPQTWVIDLYASYCRRAVNNENDVCVLKMVVRAHDVEPEDATWRLQYNDEWRQLVWHSRNEHEYTGEIDRKHEKTKVFIGPVSCDATSVFNKMPTWESVTEQNVFKRHGNHGETGIQHVFHMPRVMTALNDKARVDLFRYNPEMRWVADPKTWVAGRIKLAPA